MPRSITDYRKLSPPSLELYLAIKNAWDDYDHERFCEMSQAEDTMPGERPVIQEDELSDDDNAKFPTHSAFLRGQVKIISALSPERVSLLLQLAKECKPDRDDSVSMMDMESCVIWSATGFWLSTKGSIILHHSR